jgi:hypothetical protein
MGKHKTISSSPICLECKHFDELSDFGFKCKAFKDQIPVEIIDSIHDHKKPFKGDNGIQFEPIEIKTK